MKKIESYKNLQDELKNSKSQYLLIYKTETETSDCAFKNIEVASRENNNKILTADVNNVRKGIGSDSRIGHKFLYAGVGYGGSCFPKDVKALIKTADKNDYSLRILKAVEEVNDSQKSVLFNKLYDFFEGKLEGKKIAMWGLSFKPNTDDMREAPSLILIKKLLENGVKIFAHDPVATEETKRRIGDVIEYCEDKNETLIDADALLLVTEWNEFRVLNYKIMNKLMKNKVIFDGRNIYDPEEVREHDYTYFGIGRN